MEKSISRADMNPYQIIRNSHARLVTRFHVYVLTYGYTQRGECTRSCFHIVSSVGRSREAVTYMQ